MAGVGRIKLNNGRGGIRIVSAGGNGEPMEISEVLETKDAVKIHIAAMRKLWSGTDDEIIRRLQDNTETAEFEGKLDLLVE